jgi:uncharacterized membrane protein YoaK (UPF0700 family)
MSKLTSPNILVILMTVISGCSDAISFLALGQVLTAAMTGNTVFLGLALVHAGGLKPVGYIVALLGFMLGAAIGSFVLRNNREVKGVTSSVIAALGVEAALFMVFGILALFAPPSYGAYHLLLIVALSAAMGVQGTAARRIGVNGVPTTVITSLTTGLIESLVWNTHGSFRQGINTSTATQNSIIPASMIVVWIIDIIAYGVGAALCGAIELHWHLHAIWLPFAIVSIVLISALISGSFSGAKKNAELSA